MKVSKTERTARIADAMQNLAEDVSPEYGRGIVVGLVSALICDGVHSFDDAMAILYVNRPRTATSVANYFPESWQESWRLLERVVA